MKTTELGGGGRCPHFLILTLSFCSPWVCTIYAWIWQLRWSCAFYFGQRHSINKEENSLSKNSFGLIRKLNCDRLAVVQFLADRQSVSLFLESNYSQIIAKDQKLDQEIHRLKCRQKFSFVFHSQTKRNKSFRKQLMNGFSPHNLHYRKIQEKAWNINLYMCVNVYLAKREGQKDMLYLHQTGSPHTPLVTWHKLFDQRRCILFSWTTKTMRTFR